MQCRPLEVGEAAFPEEADKVETPRARPASRERLRGAVGKDTPRVQPGCLFCLGGFVQPSC